METTTTTETQTTTRPRCYKEFCCDAATEQLTDYGTSGRSGWIGVWGFCAQHA